MSTSSFIGTINSDWSFRGRYVHSDGYPSGVGAAVAAIITRDGVDTAMRVLTEDHYGWSSLNPDQPAIDSVDPDPSAPWGSAARCAFGFSSPRGYYSDGRFSNVPGYGIAYTTHQSQSAPDRWISGVLGGKFDDPFLEFGFLVGEGGLIVVAPYRRVTVIETIPFSGLADVDWVQLD